MAGAFAGALLLLGLGVVAGWPALPGASSGPADPATIVATASVGTCLTWSRPDAGDLAVAGCGQSHVFEVTGSADLSSAYPAGAPFPDQTTWQGVTQSGCASTATGYLGQLDPSGKYVVGALKPTAQQWASGSRTLRCGVQRSTPTGELVATTGTAKGADQSNIYPVGTCLALVKGSAGGPVPCTDPHSYEIVGIVDLHQKFATGYPQVGDQQTALGALCKPIVDAYTNGLDLGSYNLIDTWDVVKQESWTAGSYRVNCKVGALAQDNSGLSQVTNSIKGTGRGVSATTTPSSPPAGG
jgi:hypothetical protein